MADKLVSKLSRRFAGLQVASTYCPALRPGWSTKALESAGAPMPGGPISSWSRFQLRSRKNGWPAFASDQFISHDRNGSGV